MSTPSVAAVGAAAAVDREAMTAGDGVGDGVGDGLGDGVEVGISPGVQSSVGASGASIGPGNGVRTVVFSSSSRPVHSSIQATFASSQVSRCSSQPARSR
jgi:hypothetical protein